MNQNERNGYNRTSYGDYRTIERDESIVPGVDQATGARIFVNRVYNWMFCGLMITTVIAWAVAKYAVGSEAAMRSVLGLALPLMIVELVLVRRPSSWRSAPARSCSPPPARSAT